MAKTNKPAPRAIRSLNHAGASVVVAKNEEMLRRTILGCLLFEDNFYEDGISVSERIKNLVATVPPETVAALALEARTAFKLRHAPLMLVREAARIPTHRHIVADALEAVIQRPDELAEFLAMYWTETETKATKGYGYYDSMRLTTERVFKKTPIAASVKKGLARAFTKFDEYSLAKYNRNSAIKLRDVLFLCHAKPKDAAQAALWAKLAADTLATPDTWETNLSAGENKKDTFTRMLNANLDPEQKNLLGALALLRNLRGMTEAGVDPALIKNALRSMNPERVLPYRFITAANYAPQYEDALETGMLKCLDVQEKIAGKTILLVDVSGSMCAKMSDKSEMTRMDAAFGIAMLAREVCEEVDVYSFSTDVKQIAPRRGFALREAIKNSQRFGGTDLHRAVEYINKTNGKYDRIIVFTDEQSQTGIAQPNGLGYIINVASYENGVGYNSKWTHVNGFSEATIDYVREYEKSLAIHAA